MPYPIIARYVAKTFSDKDVKLSPFEKKVLRVTLKIPLGQTRSYAWVAKAAGNPKAVRAVGQALKKNPFPFLIPCHRVVRSDGCLGGYAGGVKMKKTLLEIEKEIVQVLLKTPRQHSLKKAF